MQDGHFSVGELSSKVEPCVRRWSQQWFQVHLVFVKLIIVCWLWKYSPDPAALLLHEQETSLKAQTWGGSRPFFPFPQDLVLPLLLVEGKMLPLQNILLFTFYFLKSIHSPFLNNVSSDIFSSPQSKQTSSPSMRKANWPSPRNSVSPSTSLVLQPFFVVPESPSFHCTAPHNDILQNTRQWLRRSNQIWRISHHCAFDCNTKQILDFADRLKI